MISLTQTIRNITSILFYGLLKLISLLPMWSLHAISGGVYRLIMLFGGYRQAVVKRNFARCFPDESSETIDTWISEYYRFLLDTFVETIKGLSLSGEELDGRMRLVNEEEARTWLTEDGGLILASHYGNFEWTSQRVDRFLHKNGKQTAAVYAKLSPDFLEKAIIRLRGKWGAKMVRRHQAIRDSIRLLRDGYYVGFMIDQSPAVGAPASLVEFMGTETRWISGSTKLAARVKGGVLFSRISRKGRGKYELELVLLKKLGEDLSEEEILQRYVRLLEKQVKSSPPYWLWSHNRWKGLNSS